MSLVLANLVWGKGSPRKKKKTTHEVGVPFDGLNKTPRKMVSLTSVGDRFPQFFCGLPFFLGGKASPQDGFWTSLVVGCWYLQLRNHWLKNLQHSHGLWAPGCKDQDRPPMASASWNQALS